MSDPMLPAGTRLALVLSGGNALGAYHAGLYEALHESGLEPDWVLGTSIGAVTGAVIAGSQRAERLARLRELWRPGTTGRDPSLAWDWMPESWRRTGAVMETLFAGRPGLFGPLGSAAGWSGLDQRAAAPALYATLAMTDTLDGLVDFGRLNAGAPRFTIAAVDVETGAEVVMDSARQRIGPDHVRASGSLLTTFPAIEVDGRLLADGGFAANLPLDPVMTDAVPAPVVCIAADLLPLAAPRPQTLGEVMARMQDLTFAAQSARTVARWRAVLAPERHAAHGRSVALMMAVYADQAVEVAGKAMDFSPRSARHRWDCGLADGRALVRRLRAGEVEIGAPGLTVYEPARG